MNWVEEQWDKVPSVCPHGYGPVKLDTVPFQSGRMSHPVQIPGTYDCPDECPVELRHTDREA